MTVSTRFLARAGLIALAVGMVAVVSEARDRSEADRSWKSSWEARQAREAERRRVEQTRRAYEFRRAIAHARMRSEREVGAMRASSPPVAEAMCPVLSDPAARQEYQRQARQWREQPFRRSTGLPQRTGVSVFSSSKRSNPAFARSVSPAMASAGHAVSTAVLASSASGSSSTESAHMVPLFPSASDARGRQGFARVINHSAEAGEVMIEAFDDEGASHGPLALSIGAGETVHFNSNDLKDGNAGKGLTGGTGPGQGDWRLELTSELDIEVLSYIRTTDGFLTAMHDTVAVVDGRREAAIFNPGSNRNQESLLRLVNPGEAEAVVTISAVDDKGLSPGEGATATIPAGASRTYAAAELESGSAAGLEGAIGDGTGKWRLELESEEEIVAMSLLSSPTGHLTNLSTAPDNEEDGAHAVPLFPSASDAQGRQGFLRVMNRSDEGGEVAVRAFDDTDREYETLTLAVGANETKHFNSDDLELGNADKGLIGSTGAGEGDWRLELTSELDIDVLSYIRTTDGFLTAMHDVVPRSAKRHRVVVFNPGSNVDQQSALRLVNPGEEPAEVTITGFDDRDASPGSDVVVTVPAGGSASHAAAELESGSEEFEGALGDGSGKWRLTVNADRPIVAMSLLSSPTGHLTNLSTAPERGAGPVETAPEAHEALISPIVQSKCVNCHVEGGQSGHTPLVFVRETDADHLAKNLSVFENYLAEVEGGADRILNKIQGALAHGGGVQVAAGTEEYAGFERFMELLGAVVESPDVTVGNLFDGVMLESPRRTLWRAAIVFAGRIPTAEEYAAVEGGTEDDLRRAIRRLMQGPEFHEFLIRGANDRLLTDRHGDGAVIADTDRFVDHVRKNYELSLAAHESGDRREYERWAANVQYGARRAPLELIAHTVENELPYKRVLTADYIMANPWAAEAYGALTEFEEPGNAHEFQPSEIVNYYRLGEHDCDEEGRYYCSEYVPGIGIRLIDPGTLATDFPHAGILNTKVFLERYPTTPTNRNRARSRWTYYHFLGLDIEKSESRTMDPEVLNDRTNPTLNNPKCTTCHRRLDPVAGAFQNYGNDGLYRDQPGGLDSLDEFYKSGTDLGNFELGAPDDDSPPVSVRTNLTKDDRLHLTIPEGHWGNIALDRLDVVTIENSSVVDSIEFEDPSSGHSAFVTECGHASGDHWRLHCPTDVPLSIPADGAYELEVYAWVVDEAIGTTSLGMSKTPFREEDTWYRDMLDPGLGDERVPVAYTDNSLHWLAKRIVEDARFGESAVKFWWPSIMGSEVAEQPEEGSDADFEALRLAADAQAQQVAQLADGFGRGFGWSVEGPYNLKDLLVEIVMSDWFRAESIIEDIAFRRTALRNAGARRLLTPEELARKTDAVTGFQWGRMDIGWYPPHLRRTNSLVDNHQYGLLYGGIDSDGVIERVRDVTPVMASVAKSHAVESSCPIVLREFYLLPEHERRLFFDVDESVTPVSEFGEVFEIRAASKEGTETLRLAGALSAGRRTATLTFLNDFGDDDGDRNVFIDRVDVLNDKGDIVDTREVEDEDDTEGCFRPAYDDFGIFCGGSVMVPIDIPADGRYQFEVLAWAQQHGDELAKLEVVVESDTASSAGGEAIKDKLVDLYRDMLGTRVDTGSRDVAIAYRLFVDVWERKRRAEDASFLDSPCEFYQDKDYFEGILEGARVPEEDGNYDWDRDRVDQFIDDLNPQDAHGVARTWVVVLAYLLIDYRYLYL